MVVPHSTGQLVRSMVRITGSGINREAMPSCLDLSNVSALAAAVYVPNSLPKALVRPRQSVTPGNRASKLTDKKHLETLGEILEEKRALQETLGDTASSSTIKRKRASSSEEPSRSKRIRSSNPPPEKAEKISNIQPQQLHCASAASLATGQPAQLLLISGASNVVLQTQLQGSSGSVSSTPVTSQMPTVAVQLPTVLVQHNYASNSPAVQTGIAHATPQMNQIRTANVAVASGKFVQAKQLTSNIRYSNITTVNQPQNPPGPSSLLSSHQSLVKELLQERNRLKAINESLQLTLTKYQNLFKNKESLEKLARYVAVEGKA